MRIDTGKCIRCAGCVSVCPVLALVLDEGRIRVDEDKCIKCGNCEKVCPAGAINLEE